MGCNTCHYQWSSLIKLQSRLDEANLYNSRLITDNWRRDVLNSEIQRRYDNNVETLRWVAAERAEWINELDDYKARLTSERLECAIAKNDLKNEFKSHIETEGNLERERDTTSRLADMVDAFLAARYTETESTIPENFNPGNILRENWDLERQAKQMREGIQVKDSLIEWLEKKLENSKEEKKEMDQKLAEKQAENLRLEQKLVQNCEL